MRTLFQHPSCWWGCEIHVQCMCGKFRTGIHPLTSFYFYGWLSILSLRMENPSKSWHFEFGWISIVDLTAKGTHKPNVCFQDQVECLVVFARWNKTSDFCVSLLFVQYRYIPICNTKKDMYKTKYSPLNNSRTYTNVYIGIGSICKYKSHWNRTAFIKLG